MKRPSQTPPARPDKRAVAKDVSGKGASRSEGNEAGQAAAKKFAAKKNAAKKAATRKSAAQEAALIRQEVTRIVARTAAVPPFTGSDLAQWRKAHRYTVAGFAARLPVAVHTVRDWERDHTRIPTYLRRVLKDIEREACPNDRPRVRDMTPQESRVLIGQIITDYAPDFEGYERLLLSNGWALVLSGERAEGRWFVENSHSGEGDADEDDDGEDDDLDGKSPRRDRVIRLGWGSCSSPKIMIRAFKVLFKLKQEGNAHPTPHDLLRECATMTHLSIEETLQTQRCLLHESKRMQNAMSLRNKEENEEVDKGGKNHHE